MWKNTTNAESASSFWPSVTASPLPRPAAAPQGATTTFSVAPFAHIHGEFVGGVTARVWRSFLPSPAFCSHQAPFRSVTGMEGDVIVKLSGYSRPSGLSRSQWVSLRDWQRTGKPLAVLSGILHLHFNPRLATNTVQQKREMLFLAMFTDIFLCFQYLSCYVCCLKCCILGQPQLRSTHSRWCSG